MSEGEMTPMCSKRIDLKKCKNGFVTEIVVKQQDGLLLVTATCLFDFPSSIVSMTSSGLQTNLSVQPFKEKQSVKFRLLAFTNRFYQILDT